MPGAGRAAARAGPRRGGAGGVDVVDQRDGPGDTSDRCERAGDVVSPLDQAEPTLALGRPCSTERAEQPKAPELTQIASELSGRVVAPLHAPVAVRRDEGQSCDGGSLDDIRNDVCRLVREGSLTAFLPGRNERPNGSLVGDGSPRGGEGEPPPRALEAAQDRPGGGRPTARAPRSSKPRQRGTAAATKRDTEATADDAAARKQQIQEHIPSTVGAKSARVGDESVPKVELALERVRAPNRKAEPTSHAVVGVQELLRIADVEPIASDGVAVHRRPRVQPDDEIARCVRRIPCLEIFRDQG